MCRVIIQREKLRILAFFNLLLCMYRWLVRRTQLKMRLSTLQSLSFLQSSCFKIILTQAQTRKRGVPKLRIKYNTSLAMWFPLSRCDHLGSWGTVMESTQECKIMIYVYPDVHMRREYWYSLSNWSEWPSALHNLSCYRILTWLRRQCCTCEDLWTRDTVHGQKSPLVYGC